MTYYKKNTDTHKECSSCNQLLSRDNFYTDNSRKDGITSYCKPCKLNINNRWRENNPDAMKKSQRNTRRKLSYGITAEEYENLLISQNYMCAICLIKIGHEAAVDHCHETLKVRGLLCRTCNAGLGMFKDNQVFLNNAIVYLNNYM
jgi:hypothetical protein